MEGIGRLLDLGARGNQTKKTGDDDRPLEARVAAEMENFSPPSWPTSDANSPARPLENPKLKLSGRLRGQAEAKLGGRRPKRRPTFH